MLVSRDKLAAYNIDEECFFERRTGAGTPLSRDQYFITYPAKLIVGMYDAIGNDTTGWQLEQYNGINWVEIEPDSNYSLVITTAGLGALTDIVHGGYKLTVSGIKLIDSLITNPTTPLISWTNTEFIQAGTVVFSCGTADSKNSGDHLPEILKWKFLNTTGGLQYCLTLPPEGFGSVSDQNKTEWEIGAVGLYVKSSSGTGEDVLFAIGALPTLLQKLSTEVNRAGNSIKLYLNTILNNLGIVSDLTILPEVTGSIPEVTNESMLLYPDDPLRRPYNCYVVDSLYGTGIPALAVPRVLTSPNQYKPDWAYFQPTDNYVTAQEDAFDAAVTNYDFVYWDNTSAKYKRAEGQVIEGNTTNAPNQKMPLGIRVGNSIVFSGTIINAAKSYQYTVSVVNKGSEYEVGDELLAATNAGTFKVIVSAVDSQGAIEALNTSQVLPGNIALDPNPQTVPLYLDPRSSLKTGVGATVSITATEQQNTIWNFSADWYNKPVYCDNGANAGKPTLIKTDAFLGWCIGANQIRLALDLRNEASTTVYGTTRYATSSEVQLVNSSSDSSVRTAVTPKTLKDNYLQITTPRTTSTAGGALANPIEVQTYCKFNKIVLGKGAQSPYNNTTLNPYVTDDNIAFYGNAYRANWADVAEYYEADKLYEPGTLICFGGDNEITLAIHECNGVISTKPGYQLGEIKSERTLPVALCGRVPVLFDGNCLPKKGDKIYLSSIKPGYASTVPNGPALGKVLENNCAGSRTIECVVKLTF